MSCATTGASSYLLRSAVHGKTCCVILVDAFDNLVFENITGPLGVPRDVAVGNHVFGGDGGAANDGSHVGNDEVLDERHVFNVHKRVHFVFVDKKLLRDCNEQVDLCEFFKYGRQFHRCRICDAGCRDGVSWQDVHVFGDQSSVKRVGYDLPRAHVPVLDGPVVCPLPAYFKL